jgi:hypothetical protein
MKIVLAISIILIGAIAVIFFDSNKGSWICENGQWVKEGRTSINKPNTPCPDFQSIPESTEKSKFKVFFARSGNPKEGEDCKSYSPVEREKEFTIFPEKEALDELLKGPTEDEKEQGFYTNINEGVILQKISSKDGKVEADFSKNLETGVAGSCKVEFIRSQIVETLKQFPGIDEVIITINGRSEDVLQP